MALFKQTILKLKYFLLLILKIFIPYYFEGYFLLVALLYLIINGEDFRLKIYKIKYFLKKKYLT